MREEVKLQDDDAKLAIWKRAWSTNAQKPKEERMSFKIVISAIVAALLVAVTAPAFAADAPKTKAECEKAKDMKWDDATKACVKK